MEEIRVLSWRTFVGAQSPRKVLVSCKMEAHSALVGCLDCHGRRGDDEEEEEAKGRHPESHRRCCFDVRDLHEI